MVVKEDNIKRLQRFYEANNRPAELFAVIQEYERERHRMAVEVERLMRRLPKA